MFLKYRLRFIFWTMLTVLLVFTAFVAITSISSYVKVCDNADTELVTLQDKPVESDSGIPPFAFDDFTKSTDFTDKYFIVSYDSEGNFEAANTRNDRNVTFIDAVNYGKAVHASTNTKGFIDTYRYMKFVADDSSSAIYFLDCDTSLNMFRVSTVTSIYTVLALYFIVLFIVIFFSSIIFKPVFEANERQKQFITDASHELKTPLTIISANNEIIEMEHGKSQFTTSIDNQVTRLKSMTEKLIVLSRINEGKQSLEMKEFSISDTLMEVYSSFASAFTVDNIKVDVDVDSLTYKGNERSLGELFSIILDNAQKYTPKEGTFSISMKKEGKNIIATFRNSAAEIEKGNLDVVFQRFYRLDSSHNSKTGGSGIGLAIAKEIVDFHKGKITAFSDNGKDFVIKVIL